MNIIENKIQELISLYSSVLTELAEITDSNFNDKLQSAKNMAITASSVRHDIMACDKELLAKYERDLDKLTKQIQHTYDNIIEQKQKQLSLVSSELNKLNNKKKIVVYER